MIVGIEVVLVGLVSEPGCEQSKAFSDILWVRMDEGIWRYDSELDKNNGTNSPASGKAIKLRDAWSLVML